VGRYGYSIRRFAEQRLDVSKVNKEMLRIIGLPYLAGEQ